MRGWVCEQIYRENSTKKYTNFRFPISIQTYQHFSKHDICILNESTFSIKAMKIGSLLHVNLLKLNFTAFNSFESFTANFDFLLFFRMSVEDVKIYLSS